MTSDSRILGHSSAILPLRWAANDFLQVLVNDFTLSRLHHGVQLKLRLNEDDDTIWLRQAKHLVRGAVEDFTTRAEEHQAALDKFLLDGEGVRLKFPRDQRSFPFRYASGGTLPIVRISSPPDAQGRSQPAKEYYALFYREVSPVGWNIANGGCDSRDELLMPGDAAARELREELLMIDVKNRRRYVFGEDLGKSVDRPEFAPARAFWKDILRVDPDGFQVVQVPVRWFDGPDQVVVSMGRGIPYSTHSHFLNINALDFGIEVDRVAKIQIDQDVVLCDGELYGAGLVNAPIGLFEVESFNQRFKPGCQYTPDLFFWSGVRYNGDELDEVIEKDWLPSLGGLRHDGELAEYTTKAEAGHQYGLCPVTERIVRRFLDHLTVPENLPTGPFRAFISYAGEDIRVATPVHEHVQQQVGGAGVFFSPRTMTDTNFSRAIDDALEEAHCLVVVATKLEHLTKGWVEWEWRTFHNLINSGHKPKNALLVAYISKDINPHEMPLPLRQRQYVQVERPGADLQALNPWVRACGGLERLLAR